jgi:hypothetical protein
VTEQLDLLVSHKRAPARGYRLTMTCVTPRARKNNEGGSPPAYYSVCEESGAEVGSVRDPGGGRVHWYTHEGGGCANTPLEALEAIKRLLRANE